MGEFDPHINMEKLVKASDSTYIIKEIEIEHARIKLDTPHKIIEGKNINKEDFSIFSKNISYPIFESGVYVLNFKTWKKLHYLLEEAEEDKIMGFDKLFGIRKNLWNNSYRVVSLVFGKNPFVENIFGRQPNIKKLPPLDKTCYESLLDYIHEASSVMILSPDIRIRGDNISLEEYIKFVDENVKVLTKFNNKPIFVPIQIHLSQKRLNKILEHYKKMGYTNIWVNFNASHIGGTYFARVRTLLRNIDNIMGLNNVVLYYSHIKKEINPHIKDEKTIASDILSQFFAADFIGINREPPRIIEDPEERIKELIMKGEYRNEEEYKETLKYHKARIFDPNTYYYYRLDRYPSSLPFEKNLLLKKIELNKMLNSVILYQEIENTKQFVEEQKVAIPYIKHKKAIQEHKEILEEIKIEKKKEKQKGLLEYLGEL